MPAYTCKRATKCNQAGQHEACTYSDGSRCEVDDPINSCDDCIHIKVCTASAESLCGMRRHIPIIIPGPHPFYKEMKQVIFKHCQFAEAR